MLLALVLPPVLGMVHFCWMVLSTFRRVNGMCQFVFSQFTIISSFSQMNMDYSMCHGILLSHIDAICRIISLYDVNCQFWINFWKRVLSNPEFLSFPMDKVTTLFGIGEFHINGHIPKCFPQHSPQFIPGAARTDGERLESLWSDLNKIFISCQGSTLTNCSQTLDTHFLDSNWKKTTGIGM